MKLCYCGSGYLFGDCCEPFLKKVAVAPSAVVLMRSRYSAYCVANVDYLVQTTHSSTRKLYPKSSILEFATQNHWLQLEILSATHDTVTFKAYYLDASLAPQVHYEESTFVLEDGAWYYVEGNYEL